MVLTILAYIVAILLSVAAASISVIGMAAIFSGAYLVTLVLMSLLELAKVVAATWLHRNWNTISKLFRGYLCVAVIVLMGFTSLGIYGFFTRAHIVQQVALETGEITKLPILNQEISALEGERDLLKAQIEIEQNAVKSLIGVSKKSKEAKEAIRTNNSQQKTRDKLSNDLSEVLKKIGEKTTEKIRIEGKQKELEVEIGPLRYLASFYYGREPTKEEGERVVQWLIIAIIFVFDPLALTLLMASNGARRQPEPVKTTKGLKEVLDDMEPAVDEELPMTEMDVEAFDRPKIAKRRYRRKKISTAPVPPRRPRKRRYLDLSNTKL